MASLSGRTPASTFQNILQIDNGATGVDATLRNVEDGQGQPSAMQLSTIAMHVNGALTATSISDQNGGQFATSVKVVNSLSEFPTPVANVITCEADTLYAYGENINIGLNTFDVSAGGVSFTNFNTLGKILQSDTTGTMFTGVDANFSMYRCRVACPNGQLVDVSNSAGNEGTSVFIMDQVNVTTCAKLGTITDIASWVVTGTGVFDADDGWSISCPTMRALRYENSGIATTSVSAVLIDLLDTICPFVNITNPLHAGPVGAIALKGLIDSGNVPPNAVAKHIGASYVGGISPFSGITEDDYRWGFSDNGSQVKDSSPCALLAMRGSLLDTTISSPDTPVKVNGVFNEEAFSHFSLDPSGTATYIAEKPTVVHVLLETAIEAASGNNINITVYLAKNGVIIPNSGMSNNVSNNDPKTNSIPWVLTLIQNDYLEIFVEVNGGTNNLHVIDAKIVI